MNSFFFHWTIFFITINIIISGYTYLNEHSIIYVFIFQTVELMSTSLDTKRLKENACFGGGSNLNSLYQSLNTHVYSLKKLSIVIKILSH